MIEVTPLWIGTGSHGNEYSNVNAFNCDSTRVLVQGSATGSLLDHLQLLDSTGKLIADLPLAADTEPRWSRQDPFTFYFRQANALWRWTDNSSGLHKVVVHEFTEYATISGRGESDISADGDHFVFAGTKLDGSVDVFVYSLKDGKGQVYPQREPFDGLKITANNHIVLSKSSGLFLVDVMIGPQQLTVADGHAAVTSRFGKDIVLWCSSNDPATLWDDGSPNGVVANKNAVAGIDLANPKKKIALMELDWRYEFHIATCSQDWCIVSTDCPDYSLPAQVWRVYFDRTRQPELLCNTGSVFTDIAEVNASVNWAGTKVIGRSNFGKVDANECQVWMLDITPTAPDPGSVAAPVAAALQAIGFTQAAFSAVDEGTEWVWLFHYSQGAMQPPVLYSRKLP